MTEEVITKDETKETTKEIPINIDTGLSSFITIARFHEIVIDADKVSHELALHGRMMTSMDILLAAKKFGLKAREAEISFDRLPKMTLPAIVELKDGSYIILAKMHESKLLVLYAGEQAPRVISDEEFGEIWSGKIIFFKAKVTKDNRQEFGIKWFIPEIIKYKKPMIEVLIAALTLQILGLASPLITQVVIDKVLVHNALSTLNMLAIGLIVIAVFETLMGIARNYIFTHTTNRIDVILSAKLFRHLFTLPLRYFEARRVGDTIARVRELENIRRFITGATMTLLIDMSFMIVYIAVMLFYSPILTVVVLGSLPIFVVLSLVVTRYSKRG